MIKYFKFCTFYRIIDALTPTLSNLHPLSVLNHLHMSCISRVEAANVLKQDQYLSQLQGGGSKRSTVERKKGIAAAPPTSEHEPSSILEQYIVTQVQGTVVLPKVTHKLHRKIQLNFYALQYFLCNIIC